MVVQTNVENGLFKGTNTYTDGHMLLADGTVGKVKSTAINTTLTLTGASGNDTDKLKVTVGGVESSEASLSTATTNKYGVTKLTNTASSTEESMAATPKLVADEITSAINALDVNTVAVSGKYVSTVTQTDGKISVTKANFGPSVTISQGATSNDTPTISIGVGGASATAKSLPAATISAFGVTKLSNATDSISEDLAATSAAVKAAYDLAASKTANTGTVTQITAGTGLQIGDGTNSSFTTSGTINHSNSVTAITTEGLYKFKFDAQGHITGALAQGVTDNSSNTDVASSDTNLITARTLYYQLANKGYTTNTGTVTSVTAGNGLTGGPVTTTGSISHAVPTGATSGAHDGGGGSREYIKSITTDEFGHVTGINTASETVTDTHYSAQNITTNSASSKIQTTSSLTNGNVYLNLIENDTVRSSHKISGSNLIGVTTNASGDIGIAHLTTVNAVTGQLGGTGSEYLQSITTDSYGHVVGYTTNLIYLPTSTGTAGQLLVGAGVDTMPV